MKKNNSFYLLLFVLQGMYLIFTTSCNKDDNSINDINLTGQLPVLTTNSLTNLTHSTARSGGYISSDGGSTIIARGVCWSEEEIPTIADNKTSDGSGAGSFTSNISGLTPNTIYYIRAYATNSKGTAYGMTLSFKTKLVSEILTDIDGNVYSIVPIGTQIWMAENLKTTKYSNGDIIGTTTPANLDVSGHSNPKYQWAYNGNESYAATYGRLYTWYTVADSRNVCPSGWHVPSDAEWITLINYLGGKETAGDKLKDTGTTNWIDNNPGATNSSGFTALPSGHRDFDMVFDHLGMHGTWWTATEESTNSAWNFYMYSSYSNVFRTNSNKKYGLSVRCLKD